MKTRIRALLALALLAALVLASCALGTAQAPAASEPVADLPLLTDAPAPKAEPAAEPEPAQADEPVSEPEPAAEPDPEPVSEPEPEPEPAVLEDESYYDVEHVVLYLNAFGHLPYNYITKDEARSLGWNGGSVEQVKPGAAIGGDRFGNYEGLLPKAKGRTYTECDIDTDGYSGRGSRRLIFSNDGLYFYTRDHYESFRELTVSEEGEIVWN